jgi:glycosyltransferase involved in cell wall biosynthesis
MLVINIYHMAPYPFYAGGIDSWLDNFLRSILDDGCKVNLFCFNADDLGLRTEVFTPIESPRLRIHYLPRIKRYITAPVWIAQYILAFKNTEFKALPSDLNIVLSTLPILPAVLLMWWLKIIRGRLICSVRGQIAQDCLDLEKPWLFSQVVKFVEGASLRRVDSIVANGTDTACYLEEFYSLKSTVAPNGVSEHFYARAESESKGDTLASYSGKTTFLHVGTLRPVKGIDDVLMAYSLLNEKDRRRSVLIFIGKGMVEHYSEKARCLGIDALFLGHKDNVADYLRAADFVINVSGGSGVSNALVEALMLGKPVIAWNKQTFSQVINPSNGILCTYKDHQSLRDAMYSCIHGNITFSSDRVAESARAYRWPNVYRVWEQILSDRS